MSVYLIADIKVTNNKWVPTYAASVHDLVHKHGGKYLAQRQHRDIRRQASRHGSYCIDSVSLDTGRAKLPFGSAVHTPRRRA